MAELIKLVRTYRLTTGLADQLRLAEEIIKLILPDITAFVADRLTEDAVKDARQEILKAVAISLQKFRGDTSKEFWAWCYRIARNKINDHYRKQARERTQPVAPEELWQLMDVSAQDAPLTAQTRLDLDYAIKLLTAAKPECSELLWRHYVIGLDYAEIAEERAVQYDSVRMKIGRCLDDARSLLS